MTVVWALKLKQLAAFARSRERSDALPRVPFRVSAIFLKVHHKKN